MANKKIKFELTAVNKTKAAFDKVKGGLSGISNASKVAVKGIAGLGIAIGGLATAIALVVKNSFDFIDAIGKTATRTGIATNTIQAFHLAARESGTNIEGANKALEKFARSVGDAQRGLKTQQDIFKAINVELVDAAGNYRSTDEILADTASGIANLGSQTEKTTALANLFGRQGILLNNAIEDLNARGLDGFIKRAEDLGIVLSEKVIRRTEQFNDSVGVLGMQIRAIKDNITTAFLPVFEKMQEKIANVFKRIKEDADGFDKLGMNIANSIIEGVAAAITALGEFQLVLANLAANIDIILPNMTLSFVKFANSIRDMIPMSNLFATAIELGIIKKQAELQLELNNSVKANTEFRDKMILVAQELLGLKITLDDITDSYSKYNEKTKEQANAMFDTMNPLTAFKNNLADVGKTLDQIAVNSMKKFEDSIVTGLQTGKLAFKDFATFVVEQLIRVAIQQLIIARLIDPFRSMLSGGKLGALREFNSLTDGDTLFNGDGGGFTGMGVRAGGIDGKGGFPAILHPRETVIDHTKAQGMGATVNFNISTVDAAGFDQLLASRKGLITTIINNAMNNQGKMGIV
tara:strand:+ start:1682 stop:3421 length:1740 start_codon:yes stop_codon:yes gene_type:complete